LLELEISEKEIVEQSIRNKSLFGQLKSLGYGFSIDGFGTGYSSLIHLKSLPIVELKIDRSFVGSSNEQDQALVATAINMAKNYRIRSIAVGVEVQGQLDYLHEIGCDQIQGYISTKPLQIQEFEAWVAQYYKENTLGLWENDMDERLLNSK
jgi:EAL domain-containing protein (putative c-di-GMP-specific phosphodiesterase class I)